MKKTDWIDVIKVLHEKDWSDWVIFSVSLLSTLIMLISVIFAAQSAKSSRKATELNVKLFDQQKLSIKPDLIIKNKSINYTCSPSTPTHIISWEGQPNNKEKSKAFLVLANVSKNIAKNISVFIEVKNYKDCIKLINKTSFTNYNELFFNIRPSKFNPSKDCLFVAFEWLRETHRTNGTNEFNLNGSVELLILESYDNGGEYRIEIPSSFVVFYNTLLQNFGTLNKDTNPYLQITIKYNDIMGNEHQEDLRLKFANGNLSQKVNENNIVKATFDAKRG